MADDGAPSGRVMDEDFEDVEAARNGDGEAYGRIIRRHQPEISRRMWRFTRDPAGHADLVQDVFVNAYLSLAGYRRLGPFSHWLHKIAVRTGYACWRRRAEKSAGLEDGASRRLLEPPAVSDSAEEAGELVHRALDCLPPRDRLVLTLMYLEGYSLAEIAEATGWSIVMVKVQAWRARQKLKKILRHTEAGEAGR